MLNDSKATSDAYTYTFFPYNAEIQSVKAKIKEVVPKDFKRRLTYAGKRMFSVR